MCITCVREILIDVMVVVGFVDVSIVVLVDVAGEVVIVVVVVVLAVVVVVVLVVGNSIEVSVVVSTGNSIPVMALCFCSTPNRPNFCGDVDWCPGSCGESFHLCRAGAEGRSWAALGTSDSQTEISALFKL